MPHSGRNLLLKSLKTSPNVSTLLPDYPGDLKTYVFPKGEGEYVLMERNYRKDPYGCETFPVESLKKSLDPYWDYSKKVLIDTSHIYIKFAKQIEQYFSKFGSVFFISLIRDPNHCKKTPNWEMLARCQKNNLSVLKNVLQIKYEELIQQPNSVRIKLLRLIPDIKEFSMNPDINANYIDQEISDQPFIKNDLTSYFGYTGKVSNVVNRKTATSNNKPKAEKRKVKKNINKNRKQRYLFILCPPFSGSTVLYKIINSSPDVSSFIGCKDAIEGQGQGLLIKEIPDYMSNRHNLDYKLPVNKVKQIYDKHWDKTKTILCERSPPFVHFAKQIETHFEQFGEVFFLIMIRNPYTTRWIPECGWEIFAKEQRYNIENLKNVCNINYEELVISPDKIQDKLTAFLPELSNLNFDVGEIEYFNSGDKRCEPLNDKYLHNINDVDKKNETLINHKDLLDFFNYEYIK